TPAQAGWLKMSFGPASSDAACSKSWASDVTIKARFQSLMRRLRDDGEKASTATEFAMVAPIFFLLLMGTIEAGVIFFAQSALQNAVNDAARLVKTGQSSCFTTDAGGNCQAMTPTQF